MIYIYIVYHISYLCVWFSKSVSDTTERSFVNTRRWSFTHISPEPPIEGKAQKVNCTLGTTILLCKKCLMNLSEKTRKVKKIKIFLTSLSETSEACLLFHPPTNNCPSHLRLLCQSCLGHKAFKWLDFFILRVKFKFNNWIFASCNHIVFKYLVPNIVMFGPKYCWFHLGMVFLF